MKLAVITGTFQFSPSNAFGSSTALCEALLLQKPLIVVGGTAIRHFDPYVRREGGRLGPALLTAQQPQQHAQQKERADAALCSPLEHFLFAERSDVPLPRGVPERAEFIASFDLYARRAVDERLDAFKPGRVAAEFSLLKAT